MAIGDPSYMDYGYIPNIAQAMQKNVVPDKNLNPQPYFSVAQLAHANWFSTRAHLAPLGNALLAPRKATQ